jgi:alpha-D-ribose 1-methylphosphonate 5-triphosphate diphosphatase
MTELLITNARLVLRDEVVHGSALVREGRIVDLQPGPSRLPAALDLESDYLLPGLIELHTGNLEKHLEPLPGVRWPALSALLTHDAQIASAGITTVLDALGVGDFDERSIRAQGLQAAAAALREARAQRVLRAEHLLHTASASRSSPRRSPQRSPPASTAWASSWARQTWCAAGRTLVTSAR